jgi:hypothetical protein
MEQRRSTKILGYLMCNMHGSHVLWSNGVQPRYWIFGYNKCNKHDLYVSWSKFIQPKHYEIVEDISSWDVSWVIEKENMLGGDQQLSISTTLNIRLFEDTSETESHIYGVVIYDVIS